MASESDPAATGIEDTLALPSKGDSKEDAPDPARSRRIGPYRLVQLIGEGGMGEVWLSEQVEPVRRRVAVKVIKPGMDTKQVVARFESERQALALMDHPAIAKVFDGGSTPEGRPYFVMEYVAGVPITEHCDTHRLSTRERLELFIEVCEGVQHAHQKAIIHRDLKPSNILVSLVDGRAQPKIIDFGIAKATGQRLTEKTLFTEVGAIIGTPEYMSPEQADLTGQDVDTRTDVYSLGVILYQLLTGELPFGSKELRSSSYEELRRKLKEVEPPRPSTRLITLGDAAADAAEKRRTDTGELHRQLEGDLDAITMKALEKERARRYGTPTELVADIRRHLRNEPVLARPQSRGYRLQKYVRRHRLGVGVSAGVLVLLVAFALAMGLQARRIARERDRANAERDRANTERDLARDWINHAKQLAGNRRDLSGDEWNALHPDYWKTLDALLYKAEDLRNAGDWKDVEPLARDTLNLAKRLLDEETFFTVWGRNLLSEALLGQGRLAEAEAILTEAVPIGRRVLGQEHGMASRTVVDLARVLVRSGRKEEALALLADAAHRGLEPRFVEWISTEPDLAPLRGDARFEAIVADLKKRADAHP
jgi:eukaryotic-like serine/threonine-protein kinase